VTVARVSAFAVVLLAGRALGAAAVDQTPTASKVVTVTQGGSSATGVVVLTEALATKERGPRETVKRFGETYAFSPAFLAVRRDQPTTIEFRNLQADDEHDVMLVGPDGDVLFHAVLPPLHDVSWVFTFHREGLFPFYCTMHHPAMSGQILVVAP
jgi:plastocyanin